MAINLIMKHIESYLLFCSAYPTTTGAIRSELPTVVKNGAGLLPNCFYNCVNGDTIRRGSDSTDSDDSSLVASR